MRVAMLLLELAMAAPQPVPPPAQAAAPAPPAVQAPGATATITGRLIAHDAKPLLGAAVIISPIPAPDPAAGAVGAATVHPDGRFRFSRVPAGRYVIRARAETSREGASLFAVYAVAVDGADVGNIQMVLRPAGTIEGQVVLRPRNGHAPPELTSLRVRAPLADGSPFGDTPSGTVGAGGRFRLRGVIPGVHVLTMEHLAFPWRITEARVRGRDVTRRSFEIEHDEELRNTTIVLTDTAAGLTGTVAVPPGVAPEDVLVIAFPTDAILRQVPLRYVRTARLGADGSFRVVDLAPGEYFAIAARGVSEGEAMHPGVLEQLVPLATPVTLVETRLARVPLEVRHRPPAGSAP